MHVQIKDTSSLPTSAAQQHYVSLRFFSNFLPFLFVPSFLFTCSLPQHLPGFLPHIPIAAFGKINYRTHKNIILIPIPRHIKTVYRLTPFL